MVCFLLQPAIISDYIVIETTLERVLTLWGNDPLQGGHVPGGIAHPGRVENILNVLRTKNEIDMPHFSFFSKKGRMWLEIEEGRHRLAAFSQFSLERIFIALNPHSSPDFQVALGPACRPSQISEGIERWA